VANQHNTACHQPQAVRNPRNGDSPSPSDSFKPFVTTARDPVPRPYHVTTSLSGTANTESDDLCDVNAATRFALNARTRDGHRCNDEPNAAIPRIITDGAHATPVLRDGEDLVDSLLQRHTEGIDIDDRGNVWNAQTARNSNGAVTSVYAADTAVTANDGLPVRSIPDGTLYNMWEHDDYELDAVLDAQAASRVCKLAAAHVAHAAGRVDDRAMGAHAVDNNGSGLAAAHVAHAAGRVDDRALGAHAVEADVRGGTNESKSTGGQSHRFWADRADSTALGMRGAGNGSFLLKRCLVIPRLVRGVLAVAYIRLERHLQWIVFVRSDAQDIVNWLVSLVLDAWRKVSPRYEMR